MQRINQRVINWTLISAGGLFFLFNTMIFAAEQTAGSPATANPGIVRSAGRVNQIAVNSDGGGLEVEITTSRSVAMRSQVATDPDRLILDFPEALPGSDLRGQFINRGQVKGIRVGLFSEHPPVTRVVIDLKSAQPYRIYPSGKTVLVRLMTGERQVARGGQGHLNDVSYTPPAPAKPAPVLQVSYANGRMSIVAHNVSLSQVLGEVQQRTGADIPIPPAAAQEQVVADIGLLPVRDALTALLNGSRFNFIMVGADDDPSKLKRLILSFRSGGVSQPAIVAPPTSEPAVADAPPEAEPPQPEVPQPEMQPAPPDQQAQPAEQEAPQPQDSPPPQ